MVLRQGLLRFAGALVLGAAMASASPGCAPAQVLGGRVTGGLSDVGRAVGDTAGALADTAGALVDQAAGRDLPSLDPQSLLEARTGRLAGFVQRNHRLIEADRQGDPVVRGEVLAIAPAAQALAAAQAAGFTVLRTTTLGDLGLEVEVLGAPPHTSAQDALEQLRRLDPAGAYDLNPIYFPSGLAPAGAAASSGSAIDRDAVGVRIGLIDTGAPSGLPVFKGVRIESRGFAPGAPAPAAHGAATASLLAGRLGRFRGSAPGAALYVADIYGTTAAGGSAESLAEGLAWMGQVRAPVVNISLVGPPNALVAAAVRALTARGVILVAAVGNDGPAAPPAFPASYPGVIAVTAVDAHDRVLPEAGRALHVDFAAPGADIRAAALNGGLEPVRGTSFAAPIVAGDLARMMPAPNPAAATLAVAALADQAKPAGALAGHGVVGDDIRLADGR